MKTLSVGEGQRLLIVPLAEADLYRSQISAQELADLFATLGGDAEGTTYKIVKTASGKYAIGVGDDGYIKVVPTIVEIPFDW